MKRIGIIIILLLTTAAFAQTQIEDVSFGQANQTIQWLSSVKEQCSPCQEGKISEFEVSLKNTGDNDFLVNSISLIDSYGFVFASSQPGVFVPKDNEKNFTMQSVMPPPTRGNTLYYSVCFVFSVNGQSGQSCENSARQLMIQNNIETNLAIIYILLSAIIILMAVCFMMLLRKLDSKPKRQGL
ncbi:MAG: hypothetical protein HZB65_00230 [Candidatus Aenigmarchaeota archaeon]|nr:hypothetical protein [Candidatus Aenigmarchaeota archaeon]